MAILGRYILPGTGAELICFSLVYIHIACQLWIYHVYQGDRYNGGIACQIYLGNGYLGLSRYGTKIVISTYYLLVFECHVHKGFKVAERWMTSQIWPDIQPSAKKQF